MANFTQLQLLTRWFWLILIAVTAIMLALIMVAVQPDPHLINTIQSSSPVERAVFSPNEEIIATGDDDGKIRLWNADSGKLIRTLEGHTKAVYCLDFSPNGQMLVSGSADNTIMFWQISDGSLIRVLSIPQTSSSDVYDENQHLVSSIYSVDFSPDAQMVASGGLDNTVRLWSVSDGRLLQSIQKHTKPVLSVAFSDDGKFLASGSEDGTIYLWKVNHNHLVYDLTMTSNSRTFSVDFSPDDTILASGSEDGLIRLWSVKSGDIVTIFDQQKSSIFSLAFSPDGKRLASGGGAVFVDGIAYRSYDTYIRIWQLDNGQLLTTLKGHMKNVNSVAFNPSGQTLVSGSDDETIRLWRIER